SEQPVPTPKLARFRPHLSSLVQQPGSNALPIQLVPPHSTGATAEPPLPARGAAVPPRPALLVPPAPPLPARGELPPEPPSSVPLGVSSTSCDSVHAASVTSATANEKRRPTVRRLPIHLHLMKLPTCPASRTMRSRQRTTLRCATYRERCLISK